MSERQYRAAVKSVQGQRLKAIRKHLKMSQEVFAKEIEVDKSTLAHYEIGRRIIGAEALYAIEVKFGIHAGMVIGSEELSLNS